MKKISLIFLVLLLCGCTAEPVSVIPSASSDPNKDLANITGNQADPKEPQEEKFYLNDFLSVTLDVSSAFEDYFENDTLIRDVLPVNNGYLVVYSARTSQNSDSLYYDLCFALYDQDGNYIDRIIFEDYIHMYSYFTFTIESDEFYFYGSNRDRYYKLSFDKEGQFLNEQEFRFNKDSNFAPIRSIKIGEHFYVLSQFIDRHDGLDHKDFELCKLDKNGNMIWSAPITAQLPDSKVLSAMTIQETEDQNILMVAGRYVRESLDFESLFYAIYGQDGKLIE